MPDTLEYIESYFQQSLTGEERLAFEKRCETDEIFAKEVAFYITSRAVLREELLAQKQQQWKETVVADEDIAPVISITKKTTLFRWVAYAAAACLLLAVSVFLFETQNSPQKLAANYIKTEYTILSQEMSADTDSITLAIAAYGNKDYDKALQLFEGAEQRDSLNSYVKKYIGLTYLQQNNYDKALQKFDELSKMKLQSNPGDFLKAITLVERNNAGDKEQAKALLQKVAKYNEEGDKEAEIWITKF